MATTDSPAPINITLISDSKKRDLALAQTTCLGRHPQLRAPFITCLNSLVKDQDHVTDAAVRQFIMDRWPRMEVKKDLEKDGIWGLSSWEPGKPDLIQIDYRLVLGGVGRAKELWDSAFEAKLLLSATVLHELAHHLIHWHSKGTMTNGKTTTREAGNRVETGFFGGTLRGYEKAKKKSLGVGYKSGGSVTSFSSDEVQRIVEHWEAWAKDDFSGSITLPLVAPQAGPSQGAG